MAATATLFFTISDADGDKSQISIDIIQPDVATGVDIDYMISHAWTIINPLINGHLESAGITFEVDISGFTNAAADVLSDVQEAAEFIYTTADGFLKRIRLPTFVETFFTAAGAGKLVDITQSAVTAFNTLITAGLPDASVDASPDQASTSHGEDLTAFVKGVQVWGRNRR